MQLVEKQAELKEEQNEILKLREQAAQLVSTCLVPCSTTTRCLP